MQKGTCIPSLKWMIAGVGLCVAAWSMGAAAQPPGGGPGRDQSPEETAKAIELEAKTVAQILSLNEEQTGKLVEAYKASRESQRAALQRGGGGGRGNWEERAKAVEAEREKLATALKGFLSQEQTDKAMTYLGGSTMGRGWDRMVLLLDGMELEDAKKKEALARVAEYVVESNKAMEEARAASSFDGIREKMQASKTKLDEDLGKILSAEQLAKWKEGTAMRGRGFGGGGGGGPRPNRPAGSASATPSA
jgi:Spy/CpxP family protein refolding chaperone